MIRHRQFPTAEANISPVQSAEMEEMRLNDMQKGRTEEIMAAKIRNYGTN
jgi:hypothetical protein